MDSPLCSQCLQPASYLCACQAPPICLCLSCFNPHLVSASVPHPTTPLLANKEAYERQELVSHLTALLLKMKISLEKEKNDASDELYQLYLEKCSPIYQAYTEVITWVSSEFDRLSASLESIIEDLYKPSGLNFTLETTIFISAAGHIFDRPRRFISLKDVFDRHVRVEVADMEADEEAPIAKVVKDWEMLPPCQCVRCKKIVETVRPPGVGGGQVVNERELLSYRNSFIYKNVMNIDEVESYLRQLKGNTAVSIFRKYACEFGSNSESEVQKFISLFYSNPNIDENALKRALNDSGFPLFPRSS